MASRPSLLTVVLALLLLNCGSSEKGYRKAERLDTVQAYSEFLDKHGDSEFASSAEQRIESLSWNAASDTNTLQSYTRFLDRYLGNVQEILIHVRTHSMTVEDSLDAGATNRAANDLGMLFQMHLRIRQ